MAGDLSRILIENIVRKTLKDMKDSPERSTRNLVDMALHFSAEEGTFQKRFFEIAQGMLRKEDSGYFKLIQSLAVHADSDKLMTLGMNIGYNSCVAGAKKIRSIEEERHFNIPWSIALELDDKKCSDIINTYLPVIQEGTELGIYTWMLFCSCPVTQVLALAGSFPDSAFLIFCEPDSITNKVLEAAKSVHNIMFVVKYEESVQEICELLRLMGFLYSIYIPYEEKTVDSIFNNELLRAAGDLYPIFTFFLDVCGCPKHTQTYVYDNVKRIRDEQRYATFVVDLTGDNIQIDSIISDDACFVGFDSEGHLLKLPEKQLKTEDKYNLFHCSLESILTLTFSKEKP